MIEKTTTIKNNNGRIYKLFIALPENTVTNGNKTKGSENKKYPAIFLLDGNKTFAIARSFNPDAVLIGIGYPTQNPDEIIQQRFYDLTTKAPLDAIPMREDTTPPQTGGEAEFRLFLTQNILKEVLNNYPINSNKMTLYGHSLGGLFVMNTILSDQHTIFQTYCAGDPSIWWNHHEFMEKFAKADFKNVKTPNLLIEASGKKTNHKALGTNQTSKIEALRTGPDGETVSQILNDEKNFKNNFYRFSNENHGTMIEPSIKDCLNFSLHNKLPSNMLSNTSHTHNK